MDIPPLGYVVVEDISNVTDDCRTCGDEITTRFNICCFCGYVFCGSHRDTLSFVRSEDLEGEYSYSLREHKTIPKKIAEYTFKPDQSNRLSKDNNNRYIKGIMVCEECYKRITRFEASESDYTIEDGKLNIESLGDAFGSMKDNLFG
jgi:hypothetical protein